MQSKPISKTGKLGYGGERKYLLEEESKTKTGREHASSKQIVSAVVAQYHSHPDE